MRTLVLFLVASALSVCAQTAPDHRAPKKLTGTYSIGSANLVDPGPDDSRQALLRLHLSGDAARDLFHALDVPPRRDECLGDGTMTKIASRIVCAKHPQGRHECWIGVDLKNQSLASAFAC